MANMPLVYKDAKTSTYIRTYLVPRFLKAVNVDGWTVKSLASAQDQLGQVITNYVNRTLRAAQEVPTIRPKPMPGTGYTHMMEQWSTTPSKTAISRTS